MDFLEEEEQREGDFFKKLDMLPRSDRTKIWCPGFVSRSCQAQPRSGVPKVGRHKAESRVVRAVFEAPAAKAVQQIRGPLRVFSGFSCGSWRPLWNRLHVPSSLEVRKRSWRLFHEGNSWSKYLSFAGDVIRGLPSSLLSTRKKSRLFRSCKRDHNKWGRLAFMKLRKAFLFLVIVAMLPIGISDSMSDDGKDNQKNRNRYRERGGKDHPSRSGLTPVSNQTYKDNCGACHFAYQPELLPYGSWKKLLQTVHDHFGESFDLDPATKNAISSYLEPNASERSKAKVAVKIMKSLRGHVPARITEIPYIKDKHNHISADIFGRDSIGSASNCLACHGRAEEGIYDDDYVSIPQ